MRKVVLARVLLVGVAFSGLVEAQLNDQEVPLMRPDEERIVDAQSRDFNEALVGVLEEGAASTVRIWANTTPGGGQYVAYGTVTGDGTEVLTKWSEIADFRDRLQVHPDDSTGFQATVEGVYVEEDLAVLRVGAGRRVDRAGRVTEVQPDLRPADFSEVDLPLGKFLIAPQSNGRAGAFGVVSVEERNLRETDQAHLGILADGDFTGEGVRVENVQPEFGAEAAGIQPGDVILEVDGRRISGLFELKNALSSKQPGDTVTILLDIAGVENTVEVMLSNRPVQGQFAGGRINQMERMGGALSTVRTGFSMVVQSDMKIQKNQLGGPVVDLEGRIVGISLARADRTRTYVMGSEALKQVLAGPRDSVDEALAKLAENERMLAARNRAIMPNRQRSMERAPSMRDRQSQLEDLARLSGLLDFELEELEEE